MKEAVRVVAAVDYSEPSQSAFELALAISRRRGAGLTIVHAVPPDEAFNWRARERTALLADLRERAAAAEVRLRIRLQHGDPAGVIALHARSMAADLIVVGSHQRTGLERLREGSVAERVVLQANQPVLIVPHMTTIPDAGFTNVAVAFDLSPDSQRLVERARAVSAADSRLTLVHVLPGTSDRSDAIAAHGVPHFLYRYGAVEYETSRVQAAWHQLREALPQLSDSSGRMQARVAVGNLRDEIERVADDIGADLIVAGVTSRGVLARTFGTTVSRVMRVAARPVLAVPAAALRDGTEGESRPLAA